MSNFYFIDFENLQNLDYDSINKETDQIVIFAGQNQSKISLEIIKKTQPLGKAVEWIQMEGSGRNSLDFHIAFYLGYFIALQESLCKKTKVHVLSKDGDYDNLIKHIQSLGYSCERKLTLKPEVASTVLTANLVETQKHEPVLETQNTSPIKTTKQEVKIESKQIAPLPQAQKSVIDLNTTEIYENLVDQLKKIGKLKRPRTQKTLSNYITSHYRSRKKDLNAGKVFDLLKANKKIKVTNERISYLF